ncbi:MAG: tRNA(Met) cytidine acetyltransferase [Alteromonadaceae bacterium]|nr:tRNA(Met) cytidine acetyltransferase [Alteromonadaceae bacterium]
MKSIAFLSWFDQYRQQAELMKQRRLVILSGESSWALSLLTRINSFPLNQESLNQEPLNKNSNKLINNIWHIYSDDPLFSANINRQNYRFKLGTESQYVVFADSQFNIDAFAALSGTIVAGGILFLLLPADFEKSSLYLNSCFMQRLVNKVKNNLLVTVLEQGSVEYELDENELDENKWNDKMLLNASSLKSHQPTAKLSPSIQSLKCLTQEQYQAVVAIEKVLTGHRNRPLVITADRGRGKSSAMAIAASHLLATAKQSTTKQCSAKQALHIVVTAPHQQALNIFFKQLQSSLPDVELHNNVLTHANGLIEFIPVDQLIKNPIKASLLLVDEAAAIPVYLLEQLLLQYHRCVFASTIHGYEGAGRGFTLKFQKILTKLKPEWRAIHLKQAIRWSDKDPLEDFIFDVCLLNAELPALSDDDESAGEDKPFKTDGTEFIELSSADLLCNEYLLAQVFAVLVTAHYQTSPSDLKLLLDNKQITLVALKRQEHILAVALLMREGQCSIEEVELVIRSKRRLRDQFLPQSLLTHCGFEESFNFNYFRIMRIAVHPKIQGQGIGGYFLKQIENLAKDKNIDFIGTSFGANESLLRFWQKAGFALCRIGFSQDNASGEHSALLLKTVALKTTTLKATTLKATTKQSVIFHQKVVKEFYRVFDYLLCDEFKELSPQLVWQILHFCPSEVLIELSPVDKLSVEDFIQSTRLYSTCVFGLHRWLLVHSINTYDVEILPLISRILQKHSVESICHNYNFKGKKALNSHLLNYIKRHN